MENVISIINSKENTIDFDLSVEGLDSEPEVRFVIETKEVNLSYSAKKKEKDTWSVILPPLSILEKTAYNYCIEVVADGYFFKPGKGTINVKSSAEIYVTNTKNQTLSSTSDQAKKDEKKEVKVEKKPKTESSPVTTKLGERPIAEIARSLLENEALKKSKSEPEPEAVNRTKDQRILEILKEAGFKITPPKTQRPLSSFIK